MEIEGRIKEIGETKAFGANGFRKKELVVTTAEQYPQHILVEFTQDKCDILNKYNVGENVKVSINLQGREWVNPQGETKYFNSIQGWRIEKMEQTAPAPLPARKPDPSFQSYDAVPMKDDEHDDLPF